ncbi:uncharacterized protein LOC127857796 [Dreissena polymorpha]|uniref:ZP domain-containing protein n=1 Tax=Dreissena polymorpha TaxID=45954 RepID=A0A9D4BVC1_DREPO|nr:uncharacterized protein LOC127857796 [Dreissena polymorpha]KAH3710492.1 hypothetical protein DPMN_069976 [Dreissena polymorpha]
MSKSETNHAVMYRVFLAAYLSTLVCGTTFPSGSGNVTLAPASSIAVIQMIDNTGAVTKEATTNDNVRLRIKTFTSTEYASPLVDRCWYGPLSVSVEDRGKTKLTTIAKKGCGTAWPLKAEKEGFLDNGPHELLTSLFSLSPLNQTEFSYTEFTCEIVICGRDQNCSLTCPHKRDGDFREVPDARHVNVSTVIYVQKVAATPKPTSERSDGVIIGPELAGKQEEARSTDRKSFLEENQPYFLLATLGSVTLTLICSLFLGYKYIANANRKRANNKKAELVSRDQTDVKSHVVSPPPVYSKEGIWMTPESRLPEPRYQGEEERYMLVHPVKTPRPYDDRCEVMIRSPPGGELFPEARVHGRSPVSLNSDGHQRIRSRGTDEIVGAALKEYFENRGLNL